MIKSLFIILTQINKKCFSKFLINIKCNNYDIINSHFIQKYENFVLNIWTKNPDRSERFLSSLIETCNILSQYRQKLHRDKIRQINILKINQVKTFQTYI